MAKNRPSQTKRPPQRVASGSSSAAQPTTRPSSAARSSGSRAAPAPQRISPVTIILALVVVGALAGLAIFWSQSRNQAAAPAPVVQAGTPVPSLSSQGIPTGVTPEGYPFKGNPDAKVVVEDFSDYQCSHCGTFAVTIEPRLTDEFVKSGRVKFIFRDFQFLDRTSQTSTNPNGESHRAAIAAHCAKDQGKFWEMHSVLYANQPKTPNKGGYSDQNLEGFAGQVGLNLDEFRSCMKNKAGEFNRLIERSMNDAKGKQVNGTPTFFINDRKIEGYEFDTLKAAIELAEQGTK